MTEPVGNQPVGLLPLPAKKPSSGEAKGAYRAFAAELRDAFSNGRATPDLRDLQREDEVRAFQDVRFLADAVEETGDDRLQREAGHGVLLQRDAAMETAGERVFAFVSAGDASVRITPLQSGSALLLMVPANASASPAGQRPVPTVPVVAPSMQGYQPEASAGERRAATPSATPRWFAWASGGRLQGHFVSLMPGDQGVEVRVRAGTKDAEESSRIEGEVAAWFAAQGIRISALSVETAGVSGEDNKEGGKWIP